MNTIGFSIMMMSLEAAGVRGTNAAGAGALGSIGWSS